MLQRRPQRALRTLQQHCRLQHLETPGTWMTQSRSAWQSASKAEASAAGGAGPTRISPSLPAPQVCLMRRRLRFMCCRSGPECPAAHMTACRVQVLCVRCTCALCNWPGVKQACTYWLMAAFLRACTAGN